MLKRIVSLVLTAALLLSMVPAAAAAGFARTKQWEDTLFTDVPEESWYYDSVVNAYELGLMSGYGDGKFLPKGSITLAETVTVAARIHAIAVSGREDFRQGQPWYRVYVDYALANGILPGELADYTRPATRLEFARILAKALPVQQLSAINLIDEGDIPDVAEDEAVYLLYRAGVLTGSDSQGTFLPNTNIARCEVCAIVARMAVPNLRQTLPWAKQPTLDPPGQVEEPIPLPVDPNPPVTSGVEEPDPTVPFDVTNPEAVANGEVSYNGSYVLVKFTTETTLTDDLRAAGVTALSLFLELPSGVWYKAWTDGAVETLLENLRQLPQTVTAEYDYVYETQTITDCTVEEVDSDVHGNGGYVDQWYLRSCGVQHGWGHLKHRHHGRHPHDGCEDEEDPTPDEKVGVAGDGIVVAVIDTGVDYTHEDLKANIWVNTDEIPDNGVDDDGNGYIDDYYGYNAVAGYGSAMDDNGHGTHVAGIVAATDNEMGIVGVAYNAKVMAVKAGMASGFFNQSDIAEAILYAHDNGADVINMSFGGSASSVAVTEALEYAFTNCVLVAAAGNDGAPNEYYASARPCYPAALPYVLGVMSVGEDGVESGFSNYDVFPFTSVEYEVYAPGSDMLSTIPGNRYATWSGTSMAAPMVSAVAALLRANYYDRSTYSTRFIYGQIASTGTEQAICLNPDKHGPHNLPAIVDVYAAMTRFPTPMVNAVDYRIYDETGDDDAVIDAGETVELGFTLRNQWGKAGDAVVTVDTLSQAGIADPYVTVENNTVSYGSVGTYSETDEAAAKGMIRLTVSRDCPNDYIVALHVTVRCTNGLDASDGTVYAEAPVTFYLNISRGIELPNPISEDTVLTADNYYIIPNFTLIEEGVTVTVEPGTQIQFWDQDPEEDYATLPITYLTVEGTLLVNGTAENPVQIFPSERKDTYRVEIREAGEGTVKLYHAQVVNPYLDITYAEGCYFTQNYTGKELYYRYLNGSQVSTSSTFGQILADEVRDSMFVKLGGKGSAYYNCRLDGSFTGCFFGDSAISFEGLYENCVFYGNNNDLESDRGTSNMTVYGLDDVLPASSTVRKLFRDPETGKAYVLLNGYNSSNENDNRERAETVSKFAAYMGGTLACINSEQELELIRTNLSGYSAIMGLRKNLSDGSLSWEDGTAVGDFLSVTDGSGLFGMLTVKNGAATVSMDYTGGYLLELPGPVYVETITLPETAVTLDLAHPGYAIEAEIWPEAARDGELTYRSANEAVAVVTDEGIVLPVAEGKTTVTVASADGEVSAKLQVTVIRTFYEAVVLDRTAVTMDTDSRGYQITASVEPAWLADRGLLYHAMNPAVATVSPTGLVTPVSMGEGEIWVYSADQQVWAVLTVTVKEAVALDSVSLGDDLLLVKGETHRLTPVLQPENTTKLGLAYSVEGDAVTVSADGVVTAVTPGQAVITVESTDAPGISDSIAVKVVVPVETLTAADSMYVTGMDVEEYAAEALGIAYEPADATDVRLVWETSNEDIAYVDEDGKLIKTGLGTATLRVGAVGADCTAEVHVVVLEEAVTGKVVDVQRYSGTFVALMDDGSLWTWGSGCAVPKKLNFPAATAFAFGCYKRYGNNWNGVYPDLLLLDAEGNLTCWAVPNQYSSGVDFESAKLDTTYFTATGTLSGVAQVDTSYATSLTTPESQFLIRMEDGSVWRMTSGGLKQLPVQDIVDIAARWDSHCYCLQADGTVLYVDFGSHTATPIAEGVADIASNFGSAVLETETQYLLASYDEITETVDKQGDALYFSDFYNSGNENGRFLLEDGALSAYGTNKSGELGVGCTGEVTDWTPVALTDVEEVFPRTTTTFFRTADGFYAAGANSSHSIPILATGSQPTPVKIHFGLTIPTEGPVLRAANLAQRNEALVLEEKTLTLRFDRALVPVSPANVTLKNSSGMQVAITVEQDLEKLFITPFAALNPGETYTLTVPASVVKDVYDLKNAALTVTFVAGPVTVIPAESLELGDELTLQKGETAQLNPVLTPADTTHTVVLYTSGNSAVATVDETGVITAVAPGTATISAYSKRSPAASDSITVTVKVAADGVSVKENIYVTGMDVQEDAAEALGMALTPADTTDTLNLRWETSNPEVAYVDESGMLIKLKTGNATLRATQLGTDLYAEVNLVVLEHAITGKVVDVQTYTPMTGSDSGYLRTLARLEDGSLWYWDRNAKVPVCLPFTDVQDFSVGLLSTNACYLLILDSTGTVNCYQTNNDSLAWKLNNTPLNGAPVTGAAQLESSCQKINITASYQSTTFYLRKTDGTVWGFGENGYGQLGDGTSTDRFSLIQVPVSGIVDVAASYNSCFAVFVEADGTALCTGYADGDTYRTPTTLAENVLAAEAMGPDIMLELADSYVFPIRPASSSELPPIPKLTDVDGQWYRNHRIYLDGVSYIDGMIIRDGIAYARGFEGHDDGWSGTGLGYSTFDWTPVQKLTEVENVLLREDCTYFQTADGFYATGADSERENYIPDLENVRRLTPARIHFGLQIPEIGPALRETNLDEEAVLNDTKLAVCFDQSLLSKNLNNLTLKSASGAQITATYETRLEKLIVTPYGKLTAGETYTLTVPADAVTNVYGKGNAKISLTFTAGPVETVALESVELGEDRTLSKGETLQLTPVLTPADTTQKAMRWSSSDESVVTVENGLITAVAPGTAVITASSWRNPELRDTVVVQVVIPLETVTAGEPMFVTGLDVQGEKAAEIFSLKLDPVDTTDRDLLWESSNPEIAYVDETGTLIKLQTGTVTFRATARVSGLYAEATAVIIEQTVSDEVVQLDTDYDGGYYALLADGTLWHWNSDSAVPAKLPFDNVAQFAYAITTLGQGDRYPTLLLLDKTGTVSLWRSINGAWQQYDAPLSGNTLSGVVQLNSTLRDFYLRYENGDVWGIGENNDGELGDGTTAAKKTLAQVPVSDVTEVATGSRYAVFLTADGTAYYTGYAQESLTGNWRTAWEPTAFAEAVVDIDEAGTDRVLIRWADRMNTTLGIEDIYSADVMGDAIYSNGAYNNLHSGYDRIYVQDGLAYGAGINDCGELANANERSKWTQIDHLTHVQDVWMYPHATYFRTDNGFYGTGADIPNLSTSNLYTPGRIYFGITVPEALPAVKESRLENNIITVQFDQSLNAIRSSYDGSLSIQNITLTDAAGRAVTVKRQQKLATVTVTPYAALTEGETYTLTIPANTFANVYGKHNEAITLTFTVPTAGALSTQTAESTRDFWTEEEVLALWESYAREGESACFHGNAILNRLDDGNVNNWLRLQGESGKQAYSHAIPGNYWGTTDETMIGHQILDFNDYQTMLNIREAGYLTEAPSNVWPFVVSAQVFNSDGEPVTSVGYETVTFRVTFNRDLDTEIPLDVRFGSMYPFADYALEGDFVDARTWEGTMSLTAFVSGGFQYWTVGNGRAADRPDLTLYTDRGRFPFLLDTSSAQALTLQGQATDTGVSLNWSQDDFETLAGYHVYRTVGDPNAQPIRLNASIIPADTRTFFDENVLPGEVYYYCFTVVQTDLTESAPSNKLQILSKDTMPPALVHTPVAYGTVGRNLMISAIVTDNLSLRQVQLHYRTVGEAQWKHVDMTALNSKYSAIIGGSELDVAGLEYYITAYDGVSTTTKGTAEDPYTVIIRAEAGSEDLGDVDGDGSITILDAYRVLQAASGQIVIHDEAEFKRADLNGDGILTAAEALKILKYVNGEIGSLT